MDTLLRERYEIVEVVGAGGQGEVFRARDLLHDRLVAIKVRPADMLSRSALLAEASILYALRPHPGLPIIRDDFFAEERYCLVMDWVEGTDLQTVLDTRGDPGLPYSTAVGYLAQVADALDHLHEHEPPVVHRDVKPANLILTARGKVVLVDFGSVGGQPGAAILGTDGYSPPELVTGHAVTPAADIFGFAATAHALLTGRPPGFDGDSWSDVPGERVAVVRRALNLALSADPARRPARASEIVERLRARVDSEGESSPGAPKAVSLGADRAPSISQKPLRSRPVALLASLAVIVALVITAAIIRATNNESSIGPAQRLNLIAVVDATEAAQTSAISMPLSPGHLAQAAGSLWATDTSSGTLSRIDPEQGLVTQTIPVGSGPKGVAGAAGSVWVANSLEGTVVRISPSSNTVVQRIRVGPYPTGLISGYGSLWVTDSTDGTVTVIEPETGRVSATLRARSDPTAIIVGAGGIWVTNGSMGELTEIDPFTHRIEQVVKVGNGPAGLLTAYGSIWVANSIDGTVTRVDPTSGSIRATIPTGDGSKALVAASGAVWVSNQFGGSLARIDPHTNQVTQKLRVGGSPQSVTSDGARIFVGIGTSGDAHRGGELTVLAAPSDIRLEPALGRDFVPLYDSLVTFRKEAATSGEELVPDLARGIPTPTENGTSYTLHLRSGIRYSDGSELKPRDVRHSLRRVFMQGTPDAEAFRGVVGGRGCLAHPARCNLASGVTLDAARNAVSFHLVKPDRAFLYKLTSLFIVPSRTPMGAMRSRPIPGTGPYKLLTHEVGKTAVAVRNRYFQEWSKAAQPAGYPDRIVVEVEGGDAARLVETGQASAAMIRGNQVRMVARRFPALFHEVPLQVTIFLGLNTRVPPFDNVKVRRAINFAVGRARAAHSSGQTAATTACHMLPPDFPGYRPYCPYTSNPNGNGTWTGPDLRKARRLISESGTAGMEVHVWFTSGYHTRFMVRLLRRLGYDARAQWVPADRYEEAVSNPESGAQVISARRGPDYPLASTFLLPLFHCRQRSSQPAATNFVRFCNAAVEGMMKRAVSLERTHPEEAARLWTRVDRRITDLAPVVPLYYKRLHVITAPGVGNFQPITSSAVEWPWLVDQMWVR